MNIFLLLFNPSAIFIFIKKIEYSYIQNKGISKSIQFQLNVRYLDNKYIYLTNNPLFQNRSQYIKFAREEYKYKYRSASHSMVISTFERADCFRKLFNRIIMHRPPHTEIIICDDASHSLEKNQLLKEIANNYMNENVYVIIHTHNFGAFHTKLDGFLFCVGEYIMSIDDDDDFNPDYYIELAANINKAISSKITYDFIIPRRNRAFFWVHFPVSIRSMIGSYHNHVSFAFRRSLMKNVNYPDHHFKIYRDDAPLMIPLYIQSDDKYLYQFFNQNQYNVGGLNCTTVHEGASFKKKESRQFYFNGLIFIMKFTRKYGNFNYINSYKIAYPDRDIPYDYFKI